MIIKYLGHSAFYLCGEFSVCVDPFENIGYDMQKQTVDFCLCSHKHFDHFAVNLVDCKKMIAMEMAQEAKKISLEIINSYHDKNNGANRGNNSIYKFVIDNITFCHLGDFGENVNQEIKDRLGKVDVLMIPVGGNYTIDEKEALYIIDAIKPKIVIPMHYKTDRSKIDIKPISEFLKINPYPIKKVENEFELEKSLIDGIVLTTIYLPDTANF